MGAADQATQLVALTRSFYERTHRSFSATRQGAWHGWDELWSVVGGAWEECASGVGDMRIADIACGNLRFVRFLRQKTKAPLTVYAFDECEPLLAEGLRALLEEPCEHVAIRETVCDIAAALNEGRDFMAEAVASYLAVAFGFMHHLPSFELRERLLRLMAEHASEGGFLAVSFWQFADDARLREKAQATTLRAQEAGVVDELAAGDYLLGWQGSTETFRFCHHFTEAEIDALSAGLADVADEVARFSADGKSGNLNRYVVWRRHG